MTNEELLKEAARRRASAADFKLAISSVKGLAPDTIATLKRVSEEHLAIGEALEELVRLRTQAEPPSSPVSGEGIDSRVNGG